MHALQLKATLAAKRRVCITGRRDLLIGWGMTEGPTSDHRDRATATGKYISSCAVPSWCLSQFVLLSSLLLLSPVPVSSTLYQSPSDLTTTEYDFVIVGGGTAGLVLANRLTEDSSVNVLVVEAGGSFDGNLGIEVPFLGTSLSGTSVDWNYTTVPQTGYNNRTIPYARGHVLSGSSSINLLTYNRGSNGVWDRLADASDDAGWSWDSMEPYHMMVRPRLPACIPPLM
ncbi:hypothetical protein NM688_g9217 [Phlebia brevispora]|uniref:Uncharacterized protein n=1 Tax=Phlebia brevispora TaxID=194682 RepID=A0ACC1RK15_9APHY|nr:hypothetical protein NM688_g9217 [Phlebia brevispora]